MSTENSLLMEKLMKKIANFTDEIRSLRDSNVELKKKYSEAIKQMTFEKNKLTKTLNQNKTELQKLKNDNLRLSNQVNLLKTKLTVKSKINSNLPKTIKPNHKKSSNIFSSGNCNVNTSISTIGKSRLDNSLLSTSVNKVNNAYSSNFNNLNSTRVRNKLNLKSEIMNKDFDYDINSPLQNTTNQPTNIKKTNINYNARNSNNSRYLKNLKNKLGLKNNIIQDNNNLYDNYDIAKSSSVKNKYNTIIVKTSNNNNNDSYIKTISDGGSTTKQKGENKNKIIYNSANKTENINNNKPSLKISSCSVKSSNSKNRSRLGLADLNDHESIQWSNIDDNLSGKHIKSILNNSINGKSPNSSNLKQVKIEESSNKDTIEYDKQYIEFLKSKLLGSKYNSISDNISNNIRGLSNDKSKKSEKMNNTASFISIVEENPNELLINEVASANDLIKPVISNLVTNNQNIYHFNFDKERLNAHNELLSEIFYSLNDEQLLIDSLINRLNEVSEFSKEIKEYLFSHDYLNDFSIVENKKVAEMFSSNNIDNNLVSIKTNNFDNLENQINFSKNVSNDKMLINFESFCDLIKPQIKK